MSTKVLYHANCTDGAGAALAAYLSLGPIADYIPVQYNRPPPEFDPTDIVYIVDFSYKRAQLVEIANKVAFVQVIDHHKTAKAELESIDHPNIKIWFDMNQSGAVMTWKFFHPESSPPILLQHIQDRDLWQFKLKGSKQIHRALGMHSDWRDWAQFLYKVDTLIGDGDAIIRYLDVQIQRIIANPPTEFVWTGDVVPVYSLPGFIISDALHAALEKYPDSPFAVGYIHTPEQIIYSLRSRSGSGVDVSTIAEKFGGGGHENAAGFAIKHGEQE